MRVSIIAALLATFGSLLSTTGVYAQVDAFNASRKMQGSKFYSGTVAPSASAERRAAPAITAGGGTSASFGSAAVADTSPNTPAATRPVMNADPVPQQLNPARCKQRRSNGCRSRRGNRDFERQQRIAARCNNA